VASAGVGAEVGGSAHKGRVQEAQLQERKSLAALKQLLGHAIEVLGLWKVLCDGHTSRSLPLMASVLHRQSAEKTTSSWQLLAVVGTEKVVDGTWRRRRGSGG